MPRKSKQELSYDEIKKELAEIKDMLARREHIDNDFKTLKHEFDGNGKPGYKTLRDKFLGWETKTNAIILLVIGDIILRLVQTVL